MFKKIGDKETLSDRIVKQIEKAIMDNEFEPGDKIPSEKEMCEIFNVSRTAVREAIQKLKARGLITVKKGSGIYVQEYPEKHVTDSMEMYLWLNLNKEYINYVMEVRKLFEPELARLASQNRTQKDLKKIKNTINELEKCNPKDFKKEGALDKEFHLQIARACGNPLILTMIKPIYQIMPKIRSLIYKTNESIRENAIKYHKEIYNMIKDKDSKKAYNRMQRHLQIAEKDSQKLLDNMESEGSIKHQE